MFSELATTCWEHSSKIVDLIVLATAFFTGFHFMKKSLVKEIHEDLEGLRGDVKTLKSDVGVIKDTLLTHEKRFNNQIERTDRQDARLDALLMYLLNGKKMRTDP